MQFSAISSSSQYVIRVIRIFLATTFSVINAIWRTFFADSCKKRHTKLMTWTNEPPHPLFDKVMFIEENLLLRWCDRLFLCNCGFWRDPLFTCQMTEEWIRSYGLIFARGWGGWGYCEQSVFSTTQSTTNPPFIPLWLNSATKRLVNDTDKETNN